MNNWLNGLYESGREKMMIQAITSISERQGYMEGQSELVNVEY
jgi:hypothetical protein